MGGREGSKMAEKRGWIFFERFRVFLVVLLTVVAAVIGILSYMALQQKIEVTAQVLACDELTTYNPELEAKFTYEGEEVTHLWKLSILFVNSGDTTLVGVGSQSNIIGDGLNFLFPDDTQILSSEYGTDIPDAGIGTVDPNAFKIQFSQWRPGEYIIGSFYIASDEPLDVAPCPTVPTRDIIDGDVVVQDLTERRPEEALSVFDRLPSFISIPGKFIGGSVALLLAALAILIFIGGIGGWASAHRLEKWKKHYLPSFIEYLNQSKPKISKKQKDKFKKHPYMLPNSRWAKFDGEKFTEQPPFFDSSGACIGLIIGSIFVLFGSINLFLMLMPT
jgi:hypothetical protein